MMKTLVTIVTADDGESIDDGNNDDHSDSNCKRHHYYYRINGRMSRKDNGRSSSHLILSNLILSNLMSS
jgi:hypothetical protein